MSALQLRVPLHHLIDTADKEVEGRKKTKALVQVLACQGVFSRLFLFLKGDIRRDSDHSSINSWVWLCWSRWLARAKTLLGSTVTKKGPSQEQLLTRLPREQIYCILFFFFFNRTLTAMKTFTHLNILKMRIALVPAWWSKTDVRWL